MNDVGDIFKEYVDEIINEDFEKVYNLADCILYIDPNSSTFKYSLLSKKPLALINVKGKLWYPKVLELLKLHIRMLWLIPKKENKAKLIIAKVKRQI